MGDSNWQLGLKGGLLAAARYTQELFSRQDVVDAIKACNFNKGLGPDGFDGSIL